MPRAKTAPGLAPGAGAHNPFHAGGRDRVSEQPAASVGPLWISPAEAAAQLGITIEALKKRAKQGLLGFKEGSRWRFSTADLKRYADTTETRYLRTLPRR